MSIETPPASRTERSYSPNTCWPVVEHLPADADDLPADFGPAAEHDLIPRHLWLCCNRRHPVPSYLCLRPQSFFWAQDLPAPLPDIGSESLDLGHARSTVLSQ